MNKILWPLVCLVWLAAVGLAQPVGSFLQEAYKKDAAYQEAERAVATAQDELRKVQGDSDAAPLSLSRAQEGVQVAQAKLTQSRKEAQSKALELYNALLLAQADVGLAQGRKELSALQLQAATLRFQGGALSASELAKVRDQEAQAASSLRTAQRALEQAQLRLAPYGQVRVQALGEAPALDPQKLSSKNHARLLEAQQQLREAERALALSAGPDTSVLEKTARERDVVRAKASLSELERNLEEALEAARKRYLSAVESHKLAKEAQNRAAGELEAARRRFAAGSIAQTTLRQSELSKTEADRSLLAAQAELWSAVYGLQVAGN